MDWLSALLGGLLLRTTVGGAVVVSMYYVVSQQYLFAVALLVPLIAAIVWMWTNPFNSASPGDFQDER